MKEPSVLDFVKSRLMPWKYPPVELPPETEPTDDLSTSAVSQVAPAPEAASRTTGALQPPAFVEEEHAALDKAPRTTLQLPWRSLLALFLAAAAQFSLGPSPQRAWLPGVVLLLAALTTAMWAIYRGELFAASSTDEADSADAPAAGVQQISLHLPSMLISGILAFIAFWSFSDLHFGFINLSLLILAVFFTMRIFWRPSPPPVASWLARLRPGPGPYRISISRSALLAALAIGWVAFFRYYRLGSVPPEMNSDHAEKLMDVMRVLMGNTMIFFPTNGGREALQFYLVAGLHQYFAVPLGFDILKLVTISVGFLALPFIYLLGKELGGARLAWLAFLFAGIAYWPNVVARAAMRLPFYMLFTAAVLYFLVRGLRTMQRRDFALAGLALGLSFYGYSADRILPLVVILAVVLFLLHRQSAGKRQLVILGFLALVAVSAVVFLPLLRYIASEPDAFLFRTMTRMSGLERPLEQPALLILLSNTWRALAMFSWDAGEVWVVSVPGAPALGVISGALFYLGALLMLVRYLRQRSWQDLFWLLSIPVLLLPSTLSLAFPNENPNLYRTGGAFVPVFLMVALAADSLMSALQRQVGGKNGLRLAWVLALALLAFTSLQDYHMVFSQYAERYRLSAWNTSEMGRTAKGFIETFSQADTGRALPNVWVVGYPHWVDTRLVAVQAGYPGVDFQIFTDQLEITLEIPGAKLFIFHPDDEIAEQTLQLLYPGGWLQRHTSATPGKDYMVYLALPGAP
jgi:hypothetical protein